MEKSTAVCLRIAPPGSPVFDGFPYLSTRVSPALSHISLLPQDKPLNLLWTIAASQAYLNGLSTCLVLGHGSCYYYGTDGSAKHCKEPPRGGVIVFDQLRPFREFAVTADLASRKDKLTGFGEKRDGALFGDLTKGGYQATDDEARTLAGTQENGLPAGLVRCSRCGQWKGECLDPSPNFENQVMTVQCLCDNSNLCASCGRLLYEYKLNANYLDEGNGQVWHVPGFMAFKHRCGEGLQ